MIANPSSLSTENLSGLFQLSPHPFQCGAIAFQIGMTDGFIQRHILFQIRHGLGGAAHLVEQQLDVEQRNRLTKTIACLAAGEPSVHHSRPPEK